MRKSLYGGRARWRAALIWLKHVPGKPGLARRIVLRATTLLFVVLALGGGASFALTAVLIKEQVQGSLRHEARLAAQRIELEVGNVYQHALAMAESPLLSSSLTDTAAGRGAYLAPFLQNDVLARQGATLALLDFTGEPVSVAQAEPGAVEVPPSTVDGVLLRGEVSATMVRTNGQGPYQLQILVPIKLPDSQQAEGVLLVRADLEQVAALMPDEHSHTLRFHLLLTDAGTVLIGGEQRTALFSVREPVYLGAPFADRQLFLEVGVETAGVLHLLGLWLASYVAAGVLVLLPVLLAVRRMARKLTAPLAQLTSRVDGICDSGRLDFAWEYPANDEIGRLGQSFRTMVERTARVQGELELRVAERTHELQQSKEQLAHSLRFAQSTLDGLTAHICVLDANGVIRSVNKAWREFAIANGARPEQVGPGVDYLAVCSTGGGQAGAAQVAQGLGKVLHGEQELFEWDYACLSPDRLRWFRLRASRLADGVGGVVVAHEDISATKLAEAALQDRNDQLDTLLSSSPDGLLSVDAEGMVRFANATFLRMTGIAPAAILNRPEAVLDECLRRIAHDPTGFPGLSCLRGAGEQEEAPRHLLTLADPRHSVLAVTGACSRARSVRRLYYFRDVTHEIEVDRMKSDFLATAAHELRTPMASIFGFSELLLADDFDPDTRRDLLQTIHQETDKLVTIINELLDLARIEARRGKDFRFQAVEPAALVRRALGALAIDAATWPVATFGMDHAPAVWGDSDKLYQALLNVLSNAVKYSPDGGPIAIRILGGERAHAGSVGIQVQDAGIGISPPDLARIFERFFRADTSGKIPGTGLGMPIVKEIVDLHGGEVVVDSVLGQGTVVTLWLPVGAFGDRPGMPGAPAATDRPVQASMV